MKLSFATSETFLHIRLQCFPQLEIAVCLTGYK